MNIFANSLNSNNENILCMANIMNRAIVIGTNYGNIITYEKEELDIADKSNPYNK